MVLTSPNMLLSVIYDLSKGTSKKIKFEDITVAAFKKYPEHFALKGYPQYPDADSIDKPLYLLKKKGFLHAKQKYFSLTESGKVLAEKILGHETKHGIEDEGKFTRDIKNELDRVTTSDAFKFFMKGKKDQILDTDFYAYLGVTVRTERGDFLGRLETMTRVADEAKKNKVYRKIFDLHEFLIKKFKSEIDYKKAWRGSSNVA